MITQRFRTAAAGTPHAPALADGADSLTYRQLEIASRALAHDLVPLRGRRVAIASRKAPETVVAFLACLRAGVPFVPVDTALPPERQRFILRDADCALQLGDAPLADAPLGERPPGERPPDDRPGRDSRGVPAMRVDLATLAASGAATPAGLDRAAPDDEAYVLYTSGSTGQPKGVVITHRNADAFVDWAADAFPLGPGDQVAVHAPLHFDLPVYDLYVGLGSGATLHLVPERTALFPQAFADFLRTRRISGLYAVPTALTALVHRSTATRDGLPDLRRVLFAGEEFRAAPLADLMRAAPDAQFANLYGPIETNVVTSHVVTAPPSPDDRLPIGTPLPGVTAGLRAGDGTLTLSGPGEGELLIAGRCVTPGYLNNPETTAAATVWHDGLRFHRTGDIARRDAQGVLHLLGRTDGLVKTRGYRVELGDIEAALAAHPAVDTVAVLAVPDESVTHRLHAVVVPRPGAAGDDTLERELIAHCRRALPHYMVPGRLHTADSLPTTATGKTAKRDLLTTLQLTEGA